MVALDFITGRFDDRVAWSKYKYYFVIFIVIPGLTRNLQAPVIRRRFLSLSKDDRRISFKAEPPAPCRLSAKCLQRQPTRRTLPTAPDRTGKRAQAPTRPTPRLARNKGRLEDGPKMARR